MQQTLQQLNTLINGPQTIFYNTPAQRVHERLAEFVVAPNQGWFTLEPVPFEYFHQYHYQNYP